jgi:hypothetical protein
MVAVAAPRAPAGQVVRSGRREIDAALAGWRPKRRVAAA